MVPTFVIIVIYTMFIIGNISDAVTDGIESIII